MKIFNFSDVRYKNTSLSPKTRRLVEVDFEINLSIRMIWLRKLRSHLVFVHVISWKETHFTSYDSIHIDWGHIKLTRMSRIFFFNTNHFNFLKFIIIWLNNIMSWVLIIFHINLHYILEFYLYVKSRLDS